MGAATPLAFVVGCLLLLGAGFSLFSSPNTNAVMGSVEKRSYGVASATLATMRLVGQMLSMGVASLVLALFVGPEAVGPERAAAFVMGMRAAFVLYALLCVAGVFASLARGPGGGGEWTPPPEAGCFPAGAAESGPPDEAEEPVPQPFRWRTARVGIGLALSGGRPPRGRGGPSRPRGGEEA